MLGNCPLFCVSLSPATEGETFRHMMARGSRICLKWLWWLCLIWGSMSSSLAQQHQHEQQRQREFLYVPEGGSREDGTVLRQVIYCTLCT